MSSSSPLSPPLNSPSLNCVSPAIIHQHGTMKSTPPQEMALAANSFILMAFDILLQGTKESNPTVKSNSTMESNSSPEHPLRNVPSGRESNSLDFATALSCTLGKLCNRVDAYVASIRRTRNSLAPIHQVPIEIFVEIIAHSLPADGPRIRTLTQYTSVASSWRSAITTTPSLWSIITHMDSPSAIAKAITNSGASPLDIHTAILGEEEDREEDARDSVWFDSTPIISGVWEHIERWRTVDLTVDWRSVDEIKLLALAHAPVLKSLRLTLKRPYHPSNHKYRPYQHIELFRGRADSLRLLHLDGVGIPLASPMLRYIEDLELHDVWFPPSELLELIQRNHDLRRLVVDGVTAGQAHSVVHHASPTTSHTNLLEVMFGCKLNSPATFLLPLLLIPSCQSISVALGGQPDGGALSPSALATFKHIALHISSASICAGELIWVVKPGFSHAFNCQATFQSPSSCNLTISMPSRYPSAPQWALAALEILNPAIQSFEIKVELNGEAGMGDFTVSPALFRFLGQLPRVNTLVSRSGLERSLINLMAQPLETIGGHTWLFREMRTLVCYDRRGRRMDLENLLLMIRGRYEEIAVAPLPRRLEILQLPILAQRSNVAAEIFQITGLGPHFH